MKKFSVLILAITLSLALILPAYAGEKNLIAKWEQVLPDPNDLMGWELWCSEDQTNWTKHQDIIFVDEQAEYTSEFVFTSPENQDKRWYFRIRTYDTSGNMSSWSNVAWVDIDFDAPSVPTIIEIIIKVVGQ